MRPPAAGPLVPSGVIVLLNGTSSSGKTTPAKALQRRATDPLLAIGIDTVVFALPGRWLDPPGWHEVFRYDGEGDGLTITAGPLGDRLVAGLHRMVAGLAGVHAMPATTSRSTPR